MVNDRGIWIDQSTLAGLLSRNEAPIHGTSNLRTRHYTNDWLTSMNSLRLNHEESVAR
jgi:hypothetical protein